jgi:TPR repeat protein
MPVLAAAQLLHPPAMVRLSSCYMKGTGVAKDVAQGLKWLVEATEAGHIQAMCDLAKHCISGRHAKHGIPQDPSRAEGLLRCCSCTHRHAGGVLCRGGPWAGHCRP